MKMKLVALAVASLLSGAAFAQSSVTVYGSADMSYTYGKGHIDYKGVPNPPNTGDKVYSGMTSGEWNGNRLGFKGEEALGNGLKVVFTYEYATSLSDQGGLTGVRQAFLGLDTPYGAFTAGRQYAPSGAGLMGRNSAFAIATTTPLNNILTQTGKAGFGLVNSTMGTNDASRWNNSIAFVSKDYSGFSARAIYAFSNVTSGNPVAAAGGVPAYESDYSDSNRFGLSASYANGPFNVDVIYQTVMKARTLPWAGAGEGKDVNEWFIGGAYDFKVAKLFATYQTMANKNTSPGGAQTTAGSSTAGLATTYALNSDSDIWSIGVSVPVSAAGTVRLEYANIAYDKNVADGLNGSTYGYGIGYTHDLSKRTMLYTSLAYMNNDQDSNAFAGNGGVNVGQAGNSNWQFTSGIRHFF